MPKSYSPEFRRKAPALTRTPTATSLVRVVRSGAQGGGDVVEATPEALFVERVEVEVAVEGGGSFVDGVDDDGPGAKFGSPSDAAPQCVDEKVAAQPVSLLALIDGEAGEEHDRDRVGHAPAES